MTTSEKGKSFKIVDPAGEEVPVKSQKAKGPPPAAVPITKRGGPPKAVLKKPSVGAGGAVM
jgi:hypothetical protein